MGPVDMLPPRIFCLVDILAEGTDIPRIDVIHVNVQSHVRLVPVYLGANSAHPANSLHPAKVLAVLVPAICKIGRAVD